MTREENQEKKLYNISRCKDYTNDSIRTGNNFQIWWMAFPESKMYLQPCRVSHFQFKLSLEGHDVFIQQFLKMDTSSCFPILSVSLSLVIPFHRVLFCICAISIDRVSCLLSLKILLHYCPLSIFLASLETVRSTQHTRDLKTWQT